MFRSFAVSALLALGSTQLPQGVDAAAALVSSISDNDTTTTYTSLDPQVRTLTAPRTHVVRSQRHRQRALAQKYAIDLSYIINGKTTNPVPCDNMKAQLLCHRHEDSELDHNKFCRDMQLPHAR